MNATADRVVENYLRDLRKELADLPAANRREVLDEIEEHISEACAEVGDDEIALRNVLERLGEPAEIAEDARRRFGVERRPLGAREVAALVLLLIGGLIVPFVGWFAGVILLWSSTAWSTRQKLLGTLVFPGGLTLPVFLFFFSMESEVCHGSNLNGHVTETCTGGVSSIERAARIAGILVLLLAPIVVAIVLARQRARPALSS